MLKFKLTEHATGNVVEIEARTGDIYVWEKTHKGKTLNTLLESMAFVDLYELAQVAAKREGAFDGSVDELAAAYSLDVEDEKDADPTPPGP